MKLLDHLHEVIAKDGFSLTALELFNDVIWSYYRKYGRSFAWRQTVDPYHIFISEIMLQQTQTHRVEQKYDQWCIRFPNFNSLAQAKFIDVLHCWQGLGYNRRALYVHRVAQKVIYEFDGELPADQKKLIDFPGIGPNTAASICAFAFNMPTVFIETNIRAVFIHCFFSGQLDIYDKQLVPLIEQTIDKKNPRHWYYALMDFGAMLKKHFKNPSRKSAHYTIQSKFEGSDRQIRGMILRLLLKEQKLNKQAIIDFLGKESARSERIIDQLAAERLIKKDGGFISLGGE